MSWHCSRVLVEEFLAVISWDGDASAPSSTTLTPEAYYWPDKTTEHSRLSRFGMTSEPLMASRGEELLMWYRAGFRAKTSARRASEPGLVAQKAGCGVKWRGLLAKYDPDTHSLKTAQNSLLPDLIESSVILPQWGFMLSGGIFQRPQPAHLICVTESGLLPTPRVSRGFTNPTLGKLRRDCLTTALLGKPVLGMRPNPRYVEWMMGFPIGWTELRGSETLKFQEWQQQHSLSLPADSTKEAA